MRCGTRSRRSAVGSSWSVPAWSDRSAPTSPRASPAARFVWSTSRPIALPASAPSEADLVVHASASAAGLALSLSVAANEATLLELSWYGDALVPLPLGAAFHARRLRLISSQVGQIGEGMRGRRMHRERLALALSLLADP